MTATSSDMVGNSPSETLRIMAKRFRSLRLRTKFAMALSVVFFPVWVMSVTMVNPKLYIYHRALVRVGDGEIAIYIQGCNYSGYRPIKIWEVEPIQWLPWIFSENPSQSFIAFIPLWIIAPFVFIPTFLLWRKDRRIPGVH